MGFPQDLLDDNGTVSIPDTMVFKINPLFNPTAMVETNQTEL